MSAKQTRLDIELTNLTADQLPADCRYTSLLLGEVTTVNEAALLFGKGKSTVYIAVERGKLEYRRGLTGGALLITMRSLIKLWGEPKFDILTLYHKDTKPHGKRTQRKNHIYPTPDGIHTTKVREY
jgi:hypothetical protein